MGGTANFHFSRYPRFEVPLIGLRPRLHAERAALPKAILHVLRHAVRDLTRQARQARGGLFGPRAPLKDETSFKKAAMLAADCRLQDCKDWRLGI